MPKDIELKIYMPEKVVLNDFIYRAILPFDNKTITVLKDRAPTLISLDMGIIEILNEDFQVVDQWFIANGIADIKQNTCTIFTEACFNKSQLNLETAKRLNEEFSNPFYEWLVKYFEKQEK